MRALWLLTLVACAPEAESPQGPAQPVDSAPTPSTTVVPSTTTGTTGTAPALTLDEAHAEALRLLDERLDPDRYGSADDLQLLRLLADDRGLNHVHLRQSVDGVPVFGGEGIVHLHPDGSLRAITNDFVTELDVDTTPQITGDEAIALVEVPAVMPPEPEEGDPEAAWLTEPTAELWVLPHEGEVHLVWLVQLVDYDIAAQSRMRVFVDAHTGEEVWRYENLQTIDVDTATEYDGTQTISALNIILSKTNYHTTEDAGRFLTIRMAGSAASQYYAYNLATFGGSFTDAGAGSIHWAAAVTDDYLDTVFGRDLIDDNGGPGIAFTSIADAQPILTGVAHQYHWYYGFDYPNAYWDSANALFAAGNGDGTAFGPLVSLDVVAHEMGHGVTEYTAGLIYANESGALNESMSDVFGAAVEAYNGGTTQETWEIGEDCRTPFIAGDALRYMDDPTADGSSYDHYDDRYVGAQDNGGVHWNSGIGNLAFYLATEGGNHPTYGGANLTGVGIGISEQVWYAALANYATASTDFRGFRQATLLAAEDLGYANDSPEYQTIDAAWEMVGVTPWVFLPSGYASNGVGNPSVVFRQSSQGQSNREFIMAFETQTGVATASCPNGEWSIGLATSSDGHTFTRDSSSPLIGPRADEYDACVTAHPTLMLNSAGTGLHLWYKAEKDTDQCPKGDIDCLYSGIGYASIGANLSTVSNRSSSPVVVTTEPMGYPSVVSSDGTYTMALQSYPNIHLATASAAAGPWTFDPTPALQPGITAYANDEVYNPALVCMGDSSVTSVPFNMYVGGRDRGGNWGPVVNGGVGRAIYQTLLDDWLLSAGTLYPYDGNDDWRHWSVIRLQNDRGQLLYYSENVGGANRIGLRSTVVDWVDTELASRTCPQPSGWF